MAEYWQGSEPRKCDLCHNTISTVFVDGKTIKGPWGILCLHCHNIHGCGLGTGFGQQYELRDGKWIKVAG